jgi:hypothetical protein
LKDAQSQTELGLEEQVQKEDKGDHKQLDCPFEDCDASYQRPYMLNLHIKSKHNGGSVAEREELAITLIEAYAIKKLTKALLESVGINLHPGLISKIAK